MRIVNAALLRLLGLATIMGLISLFAIFSSNHVIFDILAHFRVQYLIGLLPMIGVAFMLRRLKTLVLLFVIVAVHGYVLAVAHLPITDTVERSDQYVPLRLMSINLLISNHQFEEQLNEILDANADVIAFQEYGVQWDDFFQRQLSSLYPHRIVKTFESPFGIALFSKYPIITGGPVQFASGMKFSIDAVVKVEDQPVRILAIHPPPPVSPATFEERNATMAWVAQESLKQTGPMIVAGDFNATQWTSAFSQMEKVGQLRHARRGHGILPSWPSKLFILLVPIDHILVNNNVGVDSVHTRTPIGSDHYPVVADLVIYQ